MKILLVHPGCDISVSDVHRGLRDGLLHAGATIYDYPLNVRIESDAAYLHYIWHKGKKKAEKPTDAQVLYKAGEGLLAKALSVPVDVVLIVSGMYLHPNTMLLLQRAGVPIALLLTESPYMDDAQSRLVPLTRVCWTNERSSVGTGVQYLPHAWHPSVHTYGPPNPDVPTHDVVFVGTAFQERIDLLTAVDWDGIDLALYGEWGALGKKHPLRAYLKEGYIENSHAAALYRRAKIGLNLYRTSKGFGPDVAHVTHAESCNPRAYELAALGCFTLSSYRAEVAEIFGETVPTFRTADELSAQVREWLPQPTKRTVYALEARDAVKGETWHNRAQQVLSDLADAGIGARGDQQTEHVARVGGGN